MKSMERFQSGRDLQRQLNRMKNGFKQLQNKVKESDSNENFVNMPDKNILDLNLLLKSLMFACLFYILAHGDTTKMIKPIIGKLGNKNMDIVLMVLFVILYYVISLFI